MTLKRALNPMPDFVGRTLADRVLRAKFEERPPYQRNDYRGWIGRAKRTETKIRRLEQMLDELETGDRYMKTPWRGGTPRPE